MKKVLSILLICSMLFSMLPAVALTAEEIPAGGEAASVAYITDGLVSLFDETGINDTDGVWEDAWGENDISGMVSTDSSGFTDAGYLLAGEERVLPTALLDALKGDEFSFEMRLGETAPTDPAVNGYVTYIANNGGTTAEKFALYVQTSKGTADKLIIKTSGVSSRPTLAAGGLEAAGNSTLTVTFRAGGRVSLYVDGQLAAESDAPAANANNATGVNRLTIGSSDASKSHTTLYKGFRFYRRALSASEVAANYAVDEGKTPDTRTLRGDYITRGLVSLYNGVGKLPTDTVWADEWGSNDITGLTVSSGSGFTDEGYYSFGSRQSMPAALLQSISGEEFSFEMRLGDVAAHNPAGQNYITLIANNGGSTVEYFAIYLLVNKGTSDKFYVKTSGLSSSARPCVAEEGSAFAADSTISLTFRAGDKVCLYCDGALVQTVTAPAANGNNIAKMTRLDFGESDANKGTDVLYKGFRFYDTALSAAEIAHNFAADGTIRPYKVKTTDYVQNGLVSLYSGSAHGEDPTVWEDGWGENHLTGLGANETNYFTDDGYHLSNAQYALPTALLDVLKGEEYTLEISLGEIAPADPAVNGYIPFLCNTGTETFSLFLQLTKGTTDILTCKTSGIAQGSRPKVTTGGTALAVDSTVTVSFKAGGTCRLYVDGKLLSSVTAPASNGNDIAAATGLILGNTGSGKQFTALYRGLRFYDRQLGEEEIARNAWLDHPSLTLVETDYVQDGLVSLYSGRFNTRYGHDADSTVWYDLKGDNHIAVAKTASSYFTDTAFHLERAQYEFPAAVLDVINGDAYTVELTLGGLTTIAGTSFATFLNSTGNDNFSLFLRVAGDYLELKTAANARPKIDGGEEYFRDSTVSVTFRKGGVCTVYVDGFPVAAANVSASTGALGTLAFGHSDPARVHIADYESIRFYDRALSQEEIVANATADGNFDPNRPISRDFTSVEQPAFPIIGDLALLRTVESEAELSALTSGAVIPSTVIGYPDADLRLTDADGDNPFMTVAEFLTAAEDSFIPAFCLTDPDTVAPLCEYLEYYLFEDVTVISSSPAIVQAVRETYPVLRCMLDLSEAYDAPLGESELSEMRKLANSHLTKNLLLPAAYTDAEDIDWLIDRGIAPFMKTGTVTDTVGAIRLLLSGAYGLLCDGETANILYETADEYLLPGTMTRTVVNVGHRGYPTDAHPENTIESFLAAYENGAEMVELDIYLTLDGEIAVIHNGTTSIFNRNISVEGSTMAQLKEVYIEKNGKRFYLPSLREVFETFKDTDLRFMIEIKSGKAAIVPALKALIEEYDADYGMYDRCTVISYGSTGQAKNMRADYPEMSFGLLNSAISAVDALSAVKQIQHLAQSANAFIAPEYVGYTADYVRETQLRGMLSSIYTLSSTATIYPQMLNGVAAITGNTCPVIASLPKSLARDGDAPTVIAVDTRAALPMLATKWNGGRMDVSGSVSVKVLSGKAHADGAALIAEEAGDITVLVGYTYALGGYGSYTIYAEPFTVTAIRTVLDRTAERIDALEDFSAVSDNGVLRIGLACDRLGYCLSDAGIAALLTAAAPLFEGEELTAGVLSVYQANNGMNGRNLTSIYLRELLKRFGEDAVNDGCLFGIDDLTYTDLSGYTERFSVGFFMDGVAVTRSLEKEWALLSCFRVTSSRTSELFTLDWQALLRLYPDAVLLDGMPYAAYAAAYGEAAAYDALCGMSARSFLGGIADAVREGGNLFAEVFADRAAKCVADLGENADKPLRELPGCGGGKIVISYERNRSFAALAQTYAAYGDGEYFARVLGNETLSIPVSLGAVILDTLPGDVNGDGIISIVDVTVLLALIAEQPPAHYNAAAADLSGDGIHSILDVTLLLTRIANG